MQHVTAERGTLLVCADSAVKQFVLSLDVGEAEDSWVLADLDDVHLVVDSSEVKRIRNKLRDLLDENHVKFIQ